jgi:periplasmic protein CpxP/Spy
MDNLKFYKIVIVILVILNLGSLAFIWIGRSRGEVPKYGQAGEFLIRELTLTSPQQDNFGKLRDSHQKILLAMQERDRRLHDRFFEAIFLPVPDTLEVGIIADSIAGLRRQVEMLTFEHFKQLRQLLTKEQTEKFHRVFRQALDRVMPIPEPPPPPPLPPPPPPPGR